MTCVTAQLESLTFDNAFRKLAGHPDYDYVRLRLLVVVDNVVFSNLRAELCTELKWENQ